MAVRQRAHRTMRAAAVQPGTLEQEAAVVAPAGYQQRDRAGAEGAVARAALSTLTAARQVRPRIEHPQRVDVQAPIDATTKRPTLD